MSQVLEMLIARRDVMAKQIETRVEAQVDVDGSMVALPEAAELELRSWNAQLVLFDDRIRELQEQNNRSAALAAGLVTSDVVTTRPRSMVYHRGGSNSYFKDLRDASVGSDLTARERLVRHGQEMKDYLATSDGARIAHSLLGGAAEFRDLNRTDGTGGFFVPPMFLVEEFAALARAGRVTANQTMMEMLPGGTDSINIPRVLTGTATAIQTADNAAVQETDLTDAQITAPVRTIAGQQDVALQVVDQSPLSFDRMIFGDLMADYATRTDIQVLSGSGAAGQVLGIRNVPGINSVVYTDATPTVGELYAKIADAIQRVNTGRFLPADRVVMHPRRWGFFTAASDSAGRPLVVPSGQMPQNAAGVMLEPGAEGLVGYIQNLPVYTDSNIPINLGAGTNEDIILVFRKNDLWLWESSLRTRVLPDVLSGNLAVRFQVYGYLAFTGERYPLSIATITGTGLITPVF